MLLERRRLSGGKWEAFEAIKVGRGRIKVINEADDSSIRSWKGQGRVTGGLGRSWGWGRGEQEVHVSSVINPHKPEMKSSA